MLSRALSQQSGPPSPNAVVHVATALNHLTVLEFHEPVTMAAAGSSDFQIERESNKVFVKPVKSGAATDLFVWTASRRFAYELEITQEVKNMNFAIDSAPPAPAPPPKPVVDTATDQSVDVMLTRALLGTEEIKHTRARAAKKQVSVHVDQVFRTRGIVYIHYTIKNNSNLFYRVSTPGAYELKTERLAHFVGEPGPHPARPSHARTARQVRRNSPCLSLVPKPRPTIFTRERLPKEWFPFGRI